MSVDSLRKTFPTVATQNHYHTDFPHAQLLCVLLDIFLQDVAAELFLLLQSYHFTGLDRLLGLQKFEASNIDNPVFRNVSTLHIIIHFRGAYGALLFA